jgi:hypothetical protein
MTQSSAVPARISRVTLGVADLPRATAFHRALAAAEAVGGRPVKPAGEVFWGGYSGDPEGSLREVAHNPFRSLTNAACRSSRSADRRTHGAQRGQPVPAARPRLIQASRQMNRAYPPAIRPSAVRGSTMS